MYTAGTSGTVGQIFFLVIIVFAGTIASFAYTGSIQSYTVPSQTSKIRIEAMGAAAGNNNRNDAGFGATIIGEFSAAVDQVLNL